MACHEHGWVEADSILVNKTRVGQASRQDSSSDFNLSGWLNLQPRIAVSMSP
jgi:hypothetical protein